MRTRTTRAQEPTWRQARRQETRTYEVGRAGRARRYYDDPVGFAQDVIPIVLWAEQRLILEAIRDSLDVAIKSGRRPARRRLVCAALAASASARV